MSATGSSITLGQGDVGNTITVTASYTDDQGTSESVASSATSAVANVNDDPTGSVTISGTATQGETLTASNTLADADGLGTITYTWSNSATGSSITLGQGDVGNTITVTASYTDDQGTSESVASSATSAVANVNDDPTGSVTISGTATQGETLTASNTLADADGLGTITYTWSNSATGSSITLGQGDVGNTITVTASYTDDQGTSESVASSATSAVANVNDDPTGSVTISGTATQGETLTASNTLADADGLGTITYTWSNSATGSSITLGQGDVGNTITVTASYTDDQGTSESVASSATSAVANVNDDPTGSVTISGTATQGETLTASNTLADADGLGTITYTWSNSATGSSITLGQGDVGNTITVTASYTDDQGTSESVASSATSAVANVNDDPTGSVTISGTATQGETLTASNTLADADGLGTITYTWSNSATGSSITLGQGDVGNTITVTASYTDDQGTSESVASSATSAVANVNDDPTGSVTISGTATQGETLTASNTLADADGLGTITYTWSNSATGSSITLGQGDVGNTITVTASYTDDQGTSESVASSATSAVANVNDDPTGSVTISGTATQGETLTASNTLADADGLGTITYTWSNSATGSSITLGQGDVGNTITVTASYTDDQGTSESVASSATSAVANVNDDPTGSVTISGTATQGETLTASNTLADADGLGTITYTWSNSATGSSITLGQGDVGNTITVTASYTDDQGTSESVASSATSAVANVNDDPTGSVTISGTATQGETLTASNTLADADGLGTITYTWSNSATGSSITLGQGDVGNTITVTASYTDDQGTSESVASSATSAVANVNDDPTGSVTISGTATQGETLTASNTLADADGLGTITYTWSNSATGSSITLGQGDVGNTITVTASYTDDQGTSESVASSATSAVANVNDDPTGSVTISGTATQGETLTASNTLADADGLGTITYTWSNSATGSSITLGQGDVGNTITVTASYTDDQGTSESVASSATSAVANVNDDPTGSVTISGTATQGETLTASNTLADADGLGTITYTWSNSATGSSITLGQGDVGNTITVTASYTDDQGTSESVASSATSAVANVNDDPTITGTPSTSVDEDQAYSFTPTGADVDAGTTLTYSITGTPSWASFDTSTGALTGTPDNDDVGTDSDIVITVSDGDATASLSSFSITVSNVNDAPTITSIAVFTVEENQTSVGTAEASDPEDDTLTYSISGNELQIDSSTGVITFVSAPDFETKDEYTATVTVSDASLNDSQEIIVNITDIDDTPPVITTSSIESSIEEGDTALGSVSANETVTWSVGGTDASYLSIATNGTLTLDTEADYETKTSYSFTVTATDAVGNTTTISALVISVNDDGKVFICHVTGRGTNGKTETLEVAPDAVDAHLNHGDSLGACDSDVDIISPEITSGATGIDLDENSGSGQTIYTIIANDDVAVTSYAIAGTDPSLLSVNSSTGVVSLTADPDYETKNSYSFTVTASDAAGNTSDPTTVTFSINDLDDTIPVITLTGSDVSQEVGGSYTDAGATALDNIDGDITSNIATVNPVDPSTVGVYTVTYNVSDAAGNPAVEVTRTVTITSDVTVPVITLTGSDVSQEVGGSYTDAGATALDNIDGDITSNIATVNPVDPSTVGVYTVTYNVSDAAGNPAVEVTRTVTITSDVTVPVITSGTTGTNLDENSGSGQPIYTIIATDNVAVTSYAIAGTDVSLLSVNTSTGVVTLIADPDYETKPSYSFTVTASDAAGNTSDPTTVTFSINDLDDTAPVITTSSIESSIEEGDTALGSVSANETVTWSVGGTDASYLSIATNGTLTLDTAADYETKTSYSFTVTAIDAVGNTTTTSVLVISVNDDGKVFICHVTGRGTNGKTETLEVAPDAVDAHLNHGDSLGVCDSDVDYILPEITSGTTGTNLDENSGAGQTIYTIIANDDVAVTSYAIAGTDPSLLSVNSSTGVVSLTADPDYETKNSYSFTVTASDAASNTSDPTTVTFSINDLDDTIPVITLTGSDVSQEVGGSYTDAGATALDNIDGDITSNIATVNPVDPSTVGVYTVTYNVSDAAGNPAVEVTRTVTITSDVTVPVITLTGSDVSQEVGGSYTDAGATALDNIDGDITSNIATVNPVDPSTVGVYTVTYNVSDAAGNPAVEVTRTVTITSDVTVPVITLTGSDVSQEVGGSYTDAGATALDNIDGDITSNIATVNPVDPSTVGVYTVTYNVSDAAGNPAVEVTRTVTITSDVTVPVITSGTTGTNLDENSGSGQPIYTIIATDNVAVTSYAIAGTDVSLLSVNTSTGVVTLIADPDYETKPSYSFTVTASDAAGNTSDPTTVTFSINDLDDTAPVITTSSIESSIEEGDTALGSVSANETVTWSVGGTDASYLSIATNGTLTLDTAADYETKTSYSFTVTAIDAVGNTTTTSVLVISVNDDGKVFICHVTGRGTNGKTETLEVAPDAVDAHLNHGDSLGVCDSDVDYILPEITSGTTGTNLDENSGAGQTIYTIIANDDVAVTSYAIAGTDPSLLSVNSSTGVVSLTADPDYETKNSYSFTVTASDAASNTSDPTTVTFSINDLDDTIPVITLTGSDVSQEVGGSYTDAGATALDNIDGDITSNIATVNPVDPSTVGVYTVTYNVSDAAGNPAVEVTRTVTITSDVTVPVITLTGSDVSQEVGGSYTDAGATALDNIDGDITSNIATVNPVDPSTVGVYTVTYNVSDAAGNPAVEVTRTVTITSDVTVPVITLTGSDVSQEVGGSYTDAGATALDNIDGDITSNIATVNPVDPSTVGVYTVTYNVSDAAGNPAVEVTRTVTITSDVTVPVITSGTTGTNLDENSGSGQPIYTIIATDNVAVTSYAIAGTDVSLLSVNTSTGVVTLIADPDYETKPSYSFTVTASDAAGNTSDPTTVTFSINDLDDTAPVITTSSIESSIEEGDTALGSVSANETVTWSVGGTDASYLSIATNGTLTLDTAADYETKTSYSFTVTAIDAVGNTTTTSVLVISVNDDGKVFICHVTGRGTNGKTETLEVAPDAVDAHLNHGDSLGVCDSDVDYILPEITSGTTGTNLDENSGAGQTIYTIIANDDVAVTSYAIAGTDPSLLSVNSSTGVVSLTADPDYETKNSYSFTVTASDAASNTSDPTTVTFSINDLDDTIPVITLTGSDVSQEVGGSYTDAGATALDNIDGDITSNIATVNPVDPSTVGVYTVTYNVSDAAGNPAVEVTRTVTITSDVTVPVITSGTTGTNLDENSGSGQPIYTIIATDNVAVTSYAIAGTDVSLLSVNTSTGVVTLIADPDYETKPSYSFTVTASDAAGNTSDPTTVTFSINDLDDTAPVITTSSIESSIEEGDTALGSVSANETVTWSVGGTDASYLSIATNGTLTLDTAADYETKTSYSFTVTAIDAVGNTTTTSVLVISVNDDGKVFICHVTGRGTNGKTETLEVAPDAVDAHLNHGDSLGVCDSDVDYILPEITSGTTGTDLDENSGCWSNYLYNNSK